MSNNYVAQVESAHRTGLPAVGFPEGTKVTQIEDCYFIEVAPEPPTLEELIEQVQGKGWNVTFRLNTQQRRAIQLTMAVGKDWRFKQADLDDSDTYYSRMTKLIDALDQVPSQVIRGRK